MIAAKHHKDESRNAAESPFTECLSLRRADALYSFVEVSQDSPMYFIITKTVGILASRRDVGGLVFCIP
jgi:hypothetical protein